MLHKLQQENLLQSRDLQALPTSDLLPLCDPQGQLDTWIQRQDQVMTFKEEDWNIVHEGIEILRRLVQHHGHVVQHHL